VGLFPQFVHVFLERRRCLAHRAHGRDHLDDQIGALPGLGPGIVGILGRCPGVFGHFQDGGVHLFHGGDRLLDPVVLFLGAPVGLFDLGGEFLGGRGHAAGDLRSFGGGPGDDGVLLLDVFLLGHDRRKIRPEREGADHGAVEVEKGRGRDVELACFSGWRDIFEDGMAGLFFIERLVGQRGTGGVAKEEFPGGDAFLVFGSAFPFQGLAGLPVRPGHLVGGVEDGAGRGNAPKDALGKTELGLEFVHHVPDAIGQGFHFPLEIAGEGGFVVTGGDPGRELADGGERSEHESPVDDRDDGHHHDDHEQSDDKQNGALMIGAGLHFGRAGRHAHQPARGRDFGHGHILGFVGVGVLDKAVFHLERLLDEALIAAVLENVLFFGGMGDGGPGAVDHEGIAFFTEMDGIDEFLGEGVPDGGDGQSAEQLAIRPMNGLGGDEDQRRSGFGLDDFFGNIGLLARSDGLVVVAIGVGIGQRAGEFVVAEYQMSCLVKGEDGEQFRRILQIAFDHGDGLCLFARHGRKHRRLRSQAGRCTLGAVNIDIEDLGACLGHLAKRLFLERCGQRCCGGGDKEDQNAYSGRYGRSDCKRKNAVDAEFPHSIPPLWGRPLFFFVNWSGKSWHMKISY